MLLVLTRAWLQAMLALLVALLLLGLARVVVPLPLREAWAWRWMCWRELKASHRKAGQEQLQPKGLTPRVQLELEKAPLPSPWRVEGEEQLRLERSTKWQMQQRSVSLAPQVDQRRAKAAMVQRQPTRCPSIQTLRSTKRKPTRWLRCCSAVAFARQTLREWQ